MVMDVPVVMYVSQTWALTMYDEQEMKFSEIRLLRSTLDYTPFSTRRNNDVRHE